MWNTMLSWIESRRTARDLASRLRDPSGEAVSSSPGVDGTRPRDTHAMALRVASMFSDDMVLQRDRRVPIWGTAKPGSKVEVRFDRQLKSTKAGDDGHWRLHLDPMHASVHGRVLAIRCGAERRAFSNVAVGEVWLCSGQSNMGWTLTLSCDAERHIAAAVDRDVRFLTVPVTRADTPQAGFSATKWAPSHPEHAAHWSAVAFHFATALRRDLQVPIGIIWAALGATRIQEWTSREVNAIHDYPVPDEWNTNPASGLFNAMIAPLMPYAIRGVAWYQGEENQWGAGVYRTQLAAMIEDWRERWGQGSFPFLYVQLANFGGSRDRRWSAWAELQEAQRRTLDHPNTGMAVAIDVGDADDIHPPNKQPVGERLARLALGIVYGGDGLYSGPLFRDARREGDRVRLFFDHADGLRTSDGAPLRWFEIAEADPTGAGWPTYVPADAVIDGDTVVVSAAGIREPVSVRYAFAGNPAGCNLTNASMLPASPFRTSNTWSVTVGNDPRRPVEQVPVACHQRIRVAAGGSVALRLQVTHQPEITPVVEIVDGPAMGTLEGDAPNLVYRHCAGVGEDRFTFRARGPAGTGNVASIVIDVQGR